MHRVQALAQAMATSYHPTPSPLICASPVSYASIILWPTSSRVCTYSSDSHLGSFSSLFKNFGGDETKPIVTQVVYNYFIPPPPIPSTTPIDFGQYLKWFPRGWWCWRGSQRVSNSFSCFFSFFFLFVKIKFVKYCLFNKKEFGGLL